MMTVYRIAQLGCYIFVIIILAMAITTFDLMSVINSLLIGVFFYFLLKSWKKKIILEIDKNSDKKEPIKNKKAQINVLKEK